MKRLVEPIPILVPNYERYYSNRNHDSNHDRNNHNNQPHNNSNNNSDGVFADGSVGDLKCV